jgi:hypothetical protein
VAVHGRDRSPADRVDAVGDVRRHRGGERARRFEDRIAGRERGPAGIEDLHRRERRIRRLGEGHPDLRRRGRQRRPVGRIRRREVRVRRRDAGREDHQDRGDHEAREDAPHHDPVFVKSTAAVTGGEKGR